MSLGLADPEHSSQEAQLNYVGFRWRLWAVLSEVILYLPFYWLFQEISKLSFQLWSPAPVIAWYFSYLAAWAWFLWKFRSTPGKLILGMKVREADRDRLRWRTVLIRQYDGILMNIAISADQVWTFAGSRPERIPSSWTEIGEFYVAHESPWYWYVNVGIMLLFIIDMILIARTRKKQALHDLLAGTVVVHDKAWNWLWLLWRRRMGWTNGTRGS